LKVPVPAFRMRSRWLTAGICGTTRARPCNGSWFGIEPAYPNPPTRQRAGTIRQPRPGCLRLRPETPATVRLRERYAAVRELLDQGMQLKVIAARLGVHPDTVARYADAASIDELLVGKHRSSKLDPFKDHLDARWNAGCTDAVRLTEELRERGYPGTARTVRRRPGHRLREDPLQPQG
jgi:hypothetical protein